MVRRIWRDIALRGSIGSAKKEEGKTPITPPIAGEMLLEFDGSIPGSPPFVTSRPSPLAYHGSINRPAHPLARSRTHTHWKLTASPMMEYELSPQVWGIDLGGSESQAKRHIISIVFHPVLESGEGDHVLSTAVSTPSMRSSSPLRCATLVVLEYVRGAGPHLVASYSLR